MEKIGIISLFNFQNSNYGNRLQTYALNYYLRKNFGQYQVESLYFSYDDRKATGLRVIFYILKKLHRIPAKINSIISTKFLNKKRLEWCNNFSLNNICLCEKALSWNDLQNCDYDVFIVGSDIVWGQSEFGVSRTKFLDFNTQKNFKRISYAASFGRDWIPDKNIPVIVRCLKQFQNISVREASSVDMLHKIGIDNAVHVLDPTLLLNSEEWKSIEKKPDIPVKKFILVYLLGKNIRDREGVAKLARALNLAIVTIPYATGEYNIADKGFGDYQCKDCSPEEWIWLIHNAEYIITDSFHGTVFSTIFKKKFIVLERKFTENINNRMIDYLNTIKQSDKMVKIAQIKSLDNFTWDYEEIDKLLDEKRRLSKEFLQDALTGI